MAQNTSGHAPNVALAEGYGVIMPGHALPVARMTLHISLIHQESERHLEGGFHLAGVEPELEARLHARDHRHDAIAERGHVEIEIAERLDEAAVEPDFLLGLAQRGCERDRIVSFNLAA